jgi:hypothetical protein
MVSRQRNGIEAGALERRQMRRVSTGGGHVAAHLRTVLRMRDLQMAYGDVGRRGYRRNAAQPIIRLRLVQNQITGKYEVKGCHCLIFRKHS